MAALISFTPSLMSQGDGLGAVYGYYRGVSLPKCSYWRSRTVLGRVLGCHTGVKSLCGWIGPCPAIEGPKLKDIQLKARRISPPVKDNVFHVGGYGPNDDEETTGPGPDQDLHHWIADIKDESRWAIPEPPVKQMTICTVERVLVKELPLVEAGVAGKKSKMSNIEIDFATEFRASIEFRVDNEPSVTYSLYSNPVFVTPPSCIGGPHQVHMRELEKFQRNNYWNVENLKDTSPEDYEGNGVMVINTTGKGAETLTRAWCSERGKHAIIRHNTGPCVFCLCLQVSKQSRFGGQCVDLGFIMTNALISNGLHRVTPWNYLTLNKSC